MAMAADGSVGPGSGEGLFAVDEGIVGIDLFFQQRPHLIAAYVLLGPQGRFALVETGPQSTADRLEAALQALGLAPEALEAILVTHIHLDHAGACGLLARRSRCPIYVHEVGLPHLAEPSRLWASTARTFGDNAERFWGGVTPVPAERLRPVSEGTRLSVCGRRVDVLYTPGHASHHVALLVDGDVLFSGDAAGVWVADGSYVRPPTVPPELDVEAWEATIARIRRLKPRVLVPTHFGAQRDGLPEKLQALARRLRQWVQAVLEGMRQGLDEAALAARLDQLERDELASLGLGGEDLATVLELSTPRTVAVRAIQRYWTKHHPEQLTAAQP